jgi:hypothetical protein
MKRLILITALLLAADAMANDSRPYECMINKSKPQPRNAVCVRNCESGHAPIRAMNVVEMTFDGVEYSEKDFGPCEDKK